MQKILLSSLFLLCLCQLQAQDAAPTITWNNGSGDLKWETPGNWDTGVVPAASDNVLIEDDAVVLTGTATVQRVKVGSNGSLTISTGSTLNVSGYAGDDDGIETTPSADITNEGTINVSNLSGDQADGIMVKKDFINNGTITISGVGHHGLCTAGGTFTNNGTVTISAVGQDDNESDYLNIDDSNMLLGTVNNNGSISITVTTGDQGVYVNDGGTFNNSSSLTISATGASEGDDGIHVADASTFTNLSGGMINITDAKDYSIHVAGNCSFTNSNGGDISISGGIDGNISLDEDGTFTNSGDMTIANTLRWALYVTDESQFTNTSSGDISITNAGDYALYVDANNRATPATLTNEGTISVTGGTSSGTRTVDSGVFDNMASGTLTITTPSTQGIETQSGSSFNNAGTVTISGAVVDGIETKNDAMLNNSGTLSITGAGGDGIETRDNSTLINSGTLSVTSAQRDGIEMLSTSTLTNSGILNINSPVVDAFELEGTSTFNNLNGGVLTVTDPAADKDGLQIDGGTVNNDGKLLFVGNGSDDIELKGGSFINTANAVFEPGASPGELEVRGTGVDFGTSTTNFEITGKTAVTEYDRIDKPDGSSIIISNANAYLDWGSYVPEIGDQFRIVNGSGTVTGQFASVTSSNPDLVYDVLYWDVDDLEVGPVTDVVIKITANLPVELASLTIDKSKAGHRIAWATASETDNERFDVQRSTDAANWTTIGSVAGNGSTTSGQAYQFMDESPANGLNYYRLKQMDYDGSFELSELVSSFWSNSANSVGLFPNPVGDVLNVSVVDAEEVQSIGMYNANGALVWKSAGNTTQISTAKLPAGVYSLVVTTANSVVTQKVVKQ